MNLRGPAVTVAAACASSGYAMALGRSWLNAGWVDACVVGGCDVLSPTALAAFYNLRALSRRSDDPAWPGPVWGHSPAAPYNPQLLAKARAGALAVFEGAGFFSAS
jgi:3-oxoacyl-(acyl-carrier-protein) synthase